MSRIRSTDTTTAHGVRVQSSETCVDVTLPARKPLPGSASCDPGEPETRLAYLTSTPEQARDIAAAIRLLLGAGFSARYEIVRVLETLGFFKPATRE